MRGGGRGVRQGPSPIRCSSHIPVPVPTAISAYLFYWHVANRRVLGTLLIFAAAKLTAAATATVVVGVACSAATSTVYSGTYLTQGGQVCRRHQK